MVPDSDNPEASHINGDNIAVKSPFWTLGVMHRIRDNSGMARKTKPSRQWTGLYYARQARGMTRTRLVDLSGVSKQQLSRLENGQIRLRLDHLKPFASLLDYTPEQILLWGRFPGTLSDDAGSHDFSATAGTRRRVVAAVEGQVSEIDTRIDRGKDQVPRKRRKDGRRS